jgi:hypothetical protein
MPRAVQAPASGRRGGAIDLVPWDPGTRASSSSRRLRGDLVEADGRERPLSKLVGYSRSTGPHKGGGNGALTCCLSHRLERYGENLMRNPSYGTGRRDERPSSCKARSASQPSLRLSSTSSLLAAQTLQQRRCIRQSRLTI